MDATVKVDVAGAVARLREVMNRTEDLSPVFAGPINKSVNDMFIRVFQSEGSAYGGKRWAPHAPVTKLLRKRRGHGRGGVLRDTNRLWASLTKLGLGPDAVKLVGKQSLTRGTLVTYAEPHQTGYTSRTFVVVDKAGNPVPLYRKTPVKIPARPFIPDPMPKQMIVAWEKMITDFVTR
jgi:phage gpG-like protein